MHRQMPGFTHVMHKRILGKQRLVPCIVASLLVLAEVGAFLPDPTWYDLIIFTQYSLHVTRVIELPAYSIWDSDTPQEPLHHHSHCPWEVADRCNHNGTSHCSGRMTAWGVTHHMAAGTSSRSWQLPAQAAELFVEDATHKAVTVAALLQAGRNTGASER